MYFLQAYFFKYSLNISVYILDIPKTLWNRHLFYTSESLNAFSHWYTVPWQHIGCCYFMSVGVRNENARFMTTWCIDSTHMNIINVILCLLVLAKFCFQQNQNNVIQIIFISMMQYLILFYFPEILIKSAMGAKEWRILFKGMHACNGDCLLCSINVGWGHMHKKKKNHSFLDSFYFVIICRFVNPKNLPTTIF